MKHREDCPFHETKTELIYSKIELNNYIHEHYTCQDCVGNVNKNFANKNYKINCYLRFDPYNHDPAGLLATESFYALNKLITINYNNIDVTVTLTPFLSIPTTINGKPMLGSNSPQTFIIKYPNAIPKLLDLKKSCRSFKLTTMQNNSNSEYFQWFEE